MRSLHADSRVCAVVVTYNPAGDCRALLDALSCQCDAVVVVDNGSQADAVAVLSESCHQTGALLVSLPANVGIAAAQNIGIRHASDNGATHVLLSDHDSLPVDGMVEDLLAVISESSDIAAVGPLVAEERAGADQLVYMPRRWKPGRATPEELTQPQLEVAFLIASGCLIDLDAFAQIGPMNEALFIDHVDLEWGLRARNKGYRLVAVPSARLVHELGDEAVHLPGRAQPVHVHAPFRNYYIARNTLWLIKQKGLMPGRWRFRYAYWLAKYAAFNGVLLSDRAHERRKMLARGIGDGLRGRMGRIGRA